MDEEYEYYNFGDEDEFYMDDEDDWFDESLEDDDPEGGSSLIPRNKPPKNPSPGDALEPERELITLNVQS